jgi:hypothetical protein
MYTLTNEQIDAISLKLKEAGINYSHLFEDLLDHVCCDIESSMQQNIDFKNACDKVFNKIGFNGLEEIQEATIFYVKLNLKIMKKIMHVLAITGTGILSAGLFFKFQHWPGGSILYSLGLLIVLLGFFPTALLSIKKDLNTGLFTKKFLIYIIGFICLFVTGAAILFVNMHWPGSKKLAVFSWILMLFIFFPILFFQIIKAERNKSVNLVLSIFAFFFIAISIVSMYNNGTNPLHTVRYYELSNDIAFYKEQINALKPELAGNADIQSLQKVSGDFEAQVKKYQQTILNDQQDIYAMARKFIHSPSVQYDRYEYFTPIKKELNAFADEAIQNCKSPYLRLLISDKCNTGILDQEKFGHLYWEKRNFSASNEYVYSMISLQRMIKDVYHIQYEIMQEARHSKSPE